MKKIFLFIILSLLVVGNLQAEMFYQKVGISRDMAKNSVIEELVLKTLISDSKKISGVYIFWDDARDLKDKGIEKLNVQLQLRIEQTNSSYVITLYEKKNNGFKAIDKGIRSTSLDIINELDKLTDKLLSQIKALYPAKEKTQMDEIVVTTRTLSQFESPFPKWLFGMNFDLFNQDTEYNLDMMTNNLGNTNNQKYIKSLETKSFFNLSPIAEYYYRNTYMKFMLSADTGFDHVMARAVYAKGILGSIIMLGLEVLGNYSFSDLNVPDSIFLDGFDYPIIRPQIQNWFVSPGIFLKFNIDKNYSISFTIGSFPFGNQSLYYSNLTNAVSTSGISFEADGPAFYDVNLNIRFNNRFSMVVNYFHFGSNLRWESSQDNRPIVQILNLNSWYELSRLRVNNTYFGLGVRYEF